MRFDWVVPTLMVLFLAAGLFYYGHSASECDKAGGTLMRDAAGFYKCVDGRVIK